MSAPSAATARSRGLRARARLPRAGDRPAGSARRVVLDRARALVRARGRVRLREVDRRARNRAVPPAQRPRLRRERVGRRPGRPLARAAGAARLPRANGVDGLPEPGRRAEPLPAGREAGGGGVHACSASPAAEAEERVRAALGAGPDRGPGDGDGPVSAPALGWHAAARRDRHGAREGPGAADPRRADHRASTRPSRPRCSISSPLCRRSSTRPCCSSATTSA